MTKIGHLDIERDGDVLIARLIGEIDFSNAADIGLGLESAVPKDAIGAVVDLSVTSYLDSAGVRVLFGVGATLRRGGRALRIALPASSPLTRVVKLTGLSLTVPVDETAGDAVAAIRDEAGKRPDERNWVGGSDLGPWRPGGAA